MKIAIVGNIEYILSEQEPKPGDMCLYVREHVWPFDYNEIWDKEKCQKILDQNVL